MSVSPKTEKLTTGKGGCSQIPTLGSGPGKAFPRERYAREQCLVAEIHNSVKEDTNLADIL